jgi:hypothetical protein
VWNKRNSGVSIAKSARKRPSDRGRKEASCATSDPPTFDQVVAFSLLHQLSIPPYLPTSSNPRESLLQPQPFLSLLCPHFVFYYTIIQIAYNPSSIALDVQHPLPSWSTSRIHHHRNMVVSQVHRAADFILLIEEVLQSLLL